ncbi:MAG: hypothetical protein AAF620_08095 [Bacteroidota bacterium]
MYRFFLQVLFNCVLAGLGFSQKLVGTVVDSTDLSPVLYATITNENQRTYTFSDDLGRFELFGQVGDSISIQHLGFETNTFLATSNELELKITPLALMLQEIVVSDQVSSNIIQNDFKSKAYFAPKLNSSYAFLVKNNINEVVSLEKIVIPTKFKKGYSNSGYLVVQIYESIHGQPTNPISEQVAVEFEPSKQIIIPMFEDVAVPVDEFFIVLKRVILGQSFNNKTRNLSANPFFHSNELTLSKSRSENISFIMDNMITKGKWMRSDDYNRILGFDSMLNIKIECHVQY